MTSFAVTRVQRCHSRTVQIPSSKHFIDSMNITSSTRIFTAVSAHQQSPSFVTPPSLAFGDATASAAAAVVVDVLDTAQQSMFCAYRNRSNRSCGAGGDDNDDL